MSQNIRAYFVKMTFPGLETTILEKFQDFSRFSMTVRTYEHSQQDTSLIKIINIDINVYSFNQTV